MCAGRIDPSMVIEAFVNGADGVFIGTCLPGECHYVSGNFQARARADMIARIFENASIDPNRLTLKMMSSAESSKFVRYISDFISNIKELGPMNTNDERIHRKLLVAKNAVEGKKVRWVVAKRTQFEQEGNLYGEIFTQHELNRLLDEVILDECTSQEILILIREESLSIKEISKKMELPPPIIVRQIANLRKLGLVTVDKIEGNSPLWKAIPSPNMGEMQDG